MTTIAADVQCYRHSFT